MSKNVDNKLGKNGDRLLPSTSGPFAMPRNPLVCAMLTDVYQLTMAYAYWKAGRHEDEATFELFFRKNPFGGEFTVCCGLEECLKYINHFSFKPHEIGFLRGHVPSLAHAEDEFWEYLARLNTSKINVWALPEGSLAFPQVPLLVVRGPLIVAQLLETTLLTLVNYPCLVATNAARMVQAARSKNVPGNSPAGAGSLRRTASQFTRIPTCVEFGLRRAQGPDGGCSASHYAYLGGFSATSNVLAGELSGVPLSGTHAHAFVQTFSDLTEAQHLVLCPNPDSESALTRGTKLILVTRVLEYRRDFSTRHDPAFGTTHEGELAAFCAYASAFPKHFLCLIDTYDTLRSGLLNFVLVACVLVDLGYTPVGIRIDSGDLASLSVECANVFARHAVERPVFDQMSIVASNDINEEAIHELNRSGHAITAYGIGTHLVTCQKQPALGCVYKLVELNGQARIKISQDIGKVLIPGSKRAYRLYDATGCPILDLLTRHDEPPPTANETIECRHPFLESIRALATPSRVQPLLKEVFCQGQVVEGNVRNLMEARSMLAHELSELGPGVAVLDNPRAYNVSVSLRLYEFLHGLWEQALY